MNENKILVLASRMNGEEFILFMKSSIGYETLCYRKIEQLRETFSDLSRILTDLPPKDIGLYVGCLRMMATLKPVVIELPEENLHQILKDNMAQKHIYEFDSDSFLKSPLFYAKMKKSFVESRQIMDMMEDIHSTVRVGPDGTLGVNIIRELKDENSLFQKRI